MQQSLAINLVHLIYSTKNREPLLTAEARSKLFAYQAGIFKQWNSPAVVIGGVEDHVHALFLLSKNHTLVKVIEEVKKSSSKWIKSESRAFEGFHWQSGYGAFSLSPPHVPQIRAYIEGQTEHHKTETFQEEFRTFLERYKIEYDEKYVWD